jgi:hypothetical protein
LEEPTPVPQRNPDVPPAFIGVLRKMMAKSPDQRFSSAAEVREKLLAWASEPSALPIDKQGDKEYQEAVAALETAEPPEELIEEVIPVGIPVPEKSPRRSGTFRRFAPPLDSPTEPPRPLWAFLLLGLGAGLLILVFALGLLNHFFGH